MALFNDGIPLSTYIYARVSRHKQKAELENQIEMPKRFCYERGYSISEAYSDVASGIKFDKRKEFFAMLDKIIGGKCERVVITYKWESRVGILPVGAVIVPPVIYVGFYSAGGRMPPLREFVFQPVIRIITA
jgi:hypothetical protein